MSDFKLVYFPIGGRAEPIRLAFAANGVEIKEEFVKFPEFKKAKEAGEYLFGSVPVAEIDGKQYAQSTALLRYAARSGTGSVYPKDLKEALACDMVVDTIEEINVAMSPSIHESDPEKKVAMRKALIADDGALTKYFSGLEKFLADFKDKKHLVGDNLSMADLKLYALAKNYRKGLLDGVPADYLTKYPVLNAKATAAGDHEAVKNYYQKKGEEVWPQKA